MEFETFELSNGMRVVHKPVNSPVAHCGLFVAAGSRDEQQEEQGLAHFLEHCLFKGTQRRKAYHILSRMEDVGGELNAYTTKEETVIYTSFLSSYYNRAVELICDVAFHSVFPQKEIEKEKEVIADEINSYRDNPSEAIFDDFEEIIFPRHPLGRNILGTTLSLQQFSRLDLLQFVQRHYGTNRLVFSSVGKITGQRLKKLLEKHLSTTPLSERKVERSAPPAAAASLTEQQRTGYQTHAITGTRAYAANHPRKAALLLLNNLLGGPGMNSRLNLNIREKFGFTYYLESFYQPYSDTGLFGIYLGTDPGTAPRVLQLVDRELKKLREQKLGTLQLSKAKKQLLGQIAMAQENNNALMLAYGKSLLSFDKIDTFEQVKHKIEVLQANDLQQVAQDLFQADQMSSLLYKSKMP
jgi:predicted Zn-dependent peptidase